MSNRAKSAAIYLKRALIVAKNEKSLTLGIVSPYVLIRHLDYGATNTNEFTSVGAEYYTHGKSTFSEIYSQFIGTEKASRFYEFLKKNVFEGKEY